MCMPWKEESQTSPTNLFKNKKKSLTVQGQQVKNKKKKVHYNCGKPDHVKKIVFLLKWKKSEKLLAMWSKANLTENDDGWWIYIGPTKHICKDKELLETLKSEDDDSVLYVWNLPTKI